VNPSTAAYAVTDEYGQVQRSGSVPLGSDGSYSFVIQLQASRHGNDTDGRQVMAMVLPELTTALDLLDKVAEIHRNAITDGTSNTLAEANDKIRKHILPFSGKLPRTKRIEEVRERITKMHHQIIEMVLGHHVPGSGVPQ
jgi:hypothetical protein